VYGAVLVDELTSIEWSRTSNDVADAKIVMARQAISPDCCELIGGRYNPTTGEVQGGLEPWIHELTLYRDSELVWQGPVVRTTESKAGFTVEAFDVVGWLDKVVNTYRMRFVDKAEPGGRIKGPVTKIAETILTLNLNDTKLSRPKDWAGILDYIVRLDTKAVIRFERDGSNNKAIWAETLGNILRELNKRGLLFTTVGRALVLRGKPSSSDTAVARLSLSDFLGDVEVVRDGTTAATAAFATSQDSQDITKGRTEAVGKFGTEYGRLDVLTSVTDANAAELRQAASNALEGRYPAPIAINVPTGAQLSPEAPVTIDQLVCGERLDVVSSGWCTQIGQGFNLTDVNVSWSDGSGEKVGISLVPLSDPYGDPAPPSDDIPSALREAA
jgi:hypothetical protein